MRRRTGPAAAPGDEAGWSYYRSKMLTPEEEAFEPDVLADEAQSKKTFIFYFGKKGFDFPRCQKKPKTKH